MRTIVYVDAFNLYYGIKDMSRGTPNFPYRRLDLAKMCSLLLPKNDILGIKYFTAKVSARPRDPDQPVRQQTYLRALATLPTVSIIYGHFLTHTVSMALAQPAKDGSLFAKVIKTEEKGSDVNLATHLLVDAFRDECDMSVDITNDSDLQEPLRVVSQEFGKTVGILNPQRHPSFELKQYATFYKPIRKGVLAGSQFPVMLEDEQGQFYKPPSW